MVTVITLTMGTLYPWKCYYNTITLWRVFFIVECGISRFLCAMHVLEVQASASSPRLPLCYISFLSRPLLLSWPMEKNRVINQSLNHSLAQPIWCSGNQSLRFGTWYIYWHTHTDRHPLTYICTRQQICLRQALAIVHAAQATTNATATHTQCQIWTYQSLF